MFKFKTIIPDPIQISIEKNITTLNIQQSLLLNQELQRISMLDRANEHLDNKTTNFLQVGTLLVTIVSVFNIEGFLDASSNTSVTIISIVAFMSFGIMIALALHTWLPTKYPIPGHLEWEEMIRQYLWVTSETSYYQILSNSIAIADKLQEINNQKTNKLKWFAIILLIQIICLAIVAFLSKDFLSILASLGL